MKITEISERKGPVAFKDLKVATTTVKLGLSKKEIKAWQKARKKRATKVHGRTTIWLNIGWPKEDEPQPLTVLAAAVYDDHWEVLALYGRTHRLRLDEFSDVEKQDAA